METPDLIEAIIADIKRALGQVDPAQVDDICAAICTADRVFVAGKGRSGLQMRAFAMRLMHLGLTAHVVDDVTTPAIGSGRPAVDRLVFGAYELAAALYRHRAGGGRGAGGVYRQSGFADCAGSRGAGLYPGDQFQGGKGDGR